VIRAVPLHGKRLSADRIRDLVMEHVRAEGLESDIDVEIEVVSDIPRGPSGKIARVRNEYALARAGRPAEEPAET
jgi:acyl-coenzyme A synthetase/AMP-(fatty) acid ligase